MGRIEDGGGDGGEPVRSPLDRSRSGRLSMRGGWNAREALRVSAAPYGFRSAGFSPVATAIPPRGLHNFSRSRDDQVRLAGRIRAVWTMPTRLALGAL